MAPKAKEAPLDEEALESKRLAERSFDMGVLSRTRRLCSNNLPPTKLMLRADGKDIVKKSSSRKGRYLLVFSFQLAPAAAGKLGTLAQLDSKNPVMYLDFPQGRYKLFGTLVFPKNKYVVLRLGQKDVLCEDVLENMVVFSEGWWIGTSEENPEEKRLPEPDWLAVPQLHQKYDFSGRGAAAAAGGTTKEAEAADVMDEDEEEPASQRPQRRASRAAGGKRQRYNEDSDGHGEDADGSDDDEAELAPRKLPRLGSQQQRQQRKAQARQQPESHPVDFAGDDGSEDGDEENSPLAARAAKQQQGTLDAYFKKGAGQGSTQRQPKPAAKFKSAAVAAKPKASGAAAKAAAGGGRKKKQAAPTDSEDGEDFVDLANSSGGEEEEEEAPPSSVRPRSQRKAAGVAAKKLRIEEESEDDKDEGEAMADASSDSAASDGEGSDGDEDNGLADAGSEASEEEGSEYEPSD